ncbi:MAG TPA: DUF3857 domain-containing protein [Terriglobales bacterium]|nr:DUF3857 domain-containing protein [Terriglobales bacterium]
MLAGAQSVPSPAERLASYEQAFAQAKAPVEQLVALYRIQDIARLFAPQPMQAALSRLAATPHLDPLLAAEIASQQAMTDLRAGDGAGAAALWSKLGEIEHWQAIGPFDNASPSAIANEDGPEKTASVDLTASYQGKARKVAWRPLPFSSTLGTLDLAAFLNPAESASAYLVTWVRSGDAQPVALRLRDSGSTRVWVNGALVFQEQGSHASDGFDQHAAGAELRAGWNQILAKVGDSESSDWHFSLRFTTPEGAPLDLESSATPQANAAAAASAAASAPVVRDLTAMAKAAGNELDYAWVLNRKHNFNAGDHDDANAFQAAIAAAPSDTDAVLDFAEHDSDQSRRYQNIEKVLDTEPANLRAQLDLGTVELGRNEYWPARAAFWAALGQTTQPGNGAIAPKDAIMRQPLAALGMLETLAGMGVRPEVVAWADALHAAGQDNPAVASAVGAVFRRLGLMQPAETWFAAAHQQDAANVVVSLELADAQRRSGALDEAEATIAGALALDGEVPTLLETQARALAGLGRDPDALAAIRKAIALAPDTPALRVAAGEIERHLGHGAAAVSAWQAALNLNPQDASLRDRLQIAKGGSEAVEASFERPYTEDLAKTISAYKALPAAKRDSLQTGPVVVLADTNVANIFASGNTGRYVQQIFRVNNSNGADALSVYAVTYDPGTEDVRFLSAHVIHDDGTTADASEAGDQPISQSVGYETFYNVRNKFVQMPPMRSGDFVEIAYRTSPTTLESLYGDYFGDIDQFGSSAPTLLQQYVVLTPANKNLYFKAIRFTGNAAETTANGGKVYRWSARDLPAQVNEPLAPPAIEQEPYIAVSSFQTWDQFAGWYRALIRDTFVMDSEMVQTVADLVKGKTTEEEKVDAIYRWVIQNTHYVALEFGIHGYRPYPVTQVFHRRFGDCKDKASLLIAMLHQAGIDSEFVLVRIRELGVLDPTIPSVADFDHAIAYVPSLHLYLDGTAEYEGARELPAGDQRAFVLRVPVAGVPSLGNAIAPSSANKVVSARLTVDSHPGPLTPVVTPELPASANITSRTMNGQLDSQGNLRFQMDLEITGGDAPGYRQALQIPERQAGVLQAMLHNQLPGISVTSATVLHESEWDQPIEVSLEGSIPRFASVNGSTLLVPRQILSGHWLPQMAPLAQRTFDVLTGPPQIQIDEMRLALPAGYRAAALPAASQLDQPFAKFRADATVNGSTLTLRSRIETTQSLIPPAAYAAFRKFWTQVDSALDRPISLAPGANGGAQ